MKTKIPRDLGHDIQTNINYLKGQGEILCEIRSPNYALTLSKLEMSKGWKKTSSNIVNIYRKEKRFTKIGDKYFNTTRYAPSLLEIVDLGEDFDLKFTVAKENNKEVKEPKTYDSIYITDRISFSKGNVRIDLEDKNEVKVKVIDSDRLNYTEFIDTIFMIIDMQLDPRKKINSFFNKSMGATDKIDTNLNWNLVTKPRNLIMEDLTNDGLLDNFSITVKADGLMKFLIFHSSGVWFVQFSQVYDKDYELICPLPEGISESIYQGELIENNFYPFDCCVCNKKVVTEDNYLERIKNFKHIQGKRYGKYNILELKQFPYSQKKTEFFNQTRASLKELRNFPYKTDGLVFHPIFCPYFPVGSDKEKKDRILSKNKDVCKWKPSDLLTLDFLVKKGELYVKNNILFQGTEQNPFTKNNYTLDTTGKISSLEGMIVEFKPEKKDDLFIYKPFRIRSDKKYPNSLIVALEGWELIRDPITEDMMTGRSTRLMEKYLHDLYDDDLNICPPSRNIEHMEDYTNLTVNYITPTSDTDLTKILKIIKSKVKNVTLNYLFISGSRMRSLFSIKGNEIIFNDIKISRIDSDNYSLISPRGEYKYSLKEYDFAENGKGVGGGKKITDYILSKDERDLLQMYIMGTTYFLRGEIKQVGRLPVDITKGTRRKGGFDALGDDKLDDDKLDDNLYRMASIDEGKSLQHSLLKLVNAEYRSETLNKRLEMADKINIPDDFVNLSKHIKYGIIIKESGKDNRRYGKGDKWIILYKNEDGSYEPVVKKVGEKLIFHQTY